MEEGNKRLTKKEKRALAKAEKKKARESTQRKSKFGKWIVVVVILGLIGFGVYKFVDWVRTPVPGQVDSTSAFEVSQNEWMKGNPEAQTTLIEYSDFQCPACAQYSSVVSEALEQTGDSVRFVYRHFPLTSIHPNAFDAALSAEAAGRQGKFWEYHDLLFDKQDEWGEERNPSGKFEEYAKDLDLDIEKFKADFVSDEVRSAVTADISSGNSLRINSTPTFYLEGQQISPPATAAAFVSLLQPESGSESN